MRCVSRLACCVALLALAAGAATPAHADFVFRHQSNLMGEVNVQEDGNQNPGGDSPPENTEPDIWADDFTIDPVNNAPVASYLVSNAVVVTGFDGDATINVENDAFSPSEDDPYVRVNGGPWVRSTTIRAGQSFQVRIMTPEWSDGYRKITVTVNDAVSAEWHVQTK